MQPAGKQDATQAALTCKQLHWQCYLRSVIRYSGSQACQAQQHGIAEAWQPSQDAFHHAHSLAPDVRISVKCQPCIALPNMLLWVMAMSSACYVHTISMMTPAAKHLSLVCHTTFVSSCIASSSSSPFSEKQWQSTHVLYSQQKTQDVC